MRERLKWGIYIAPVPLIIDYFVSNFRLLIIAMDTNAYYYQQWMNAQVAAAAAGMGFDAAGIYLYLIYRYQ